MNTASAQEIAVKIKPVYKISTSNLSLKEGDCLDFVVVDDVGGSVGSVDVGDNVVGVVSFGYFCLYLGVSFVMGLFWPITIGMWIGQLILALAYKIYLKGKIK